jgi:hypothetical protein
VTLCDLNIFESPQARLLLEQIASDWNLNEQNQTEKINMLAKMYAASSNLDERQKKNLNFIFDMNLQECFFGSLGTRVNCMNELTW